MNREKLFLENRVVGRVRANPNIDGSRMNGGMFLTAAAFQENGSITSTISIENARSSLAESDAVVVSGMQRFVRGGSVKSKVFRVSAMAVAVLVIVALFAPERTLAAAKTWVGTTTDWGTASNWSPSGVPASGDDVTIPTSPTGGNFPTISSGNGTVVVKSLTFSSGATVNQTGGTLQVAGVYTNAATGTFNGTGGTIQFTANGGGATKFIGSNQFFDVIVDASIDPRFDQAASSSILVSHNFSNNNTGLNTGTNATFTFNGTGAQSISSASSMATFGNLVINNTGGTVSLSTDITAVAGTLTVKAGSVLDISTHTFGSSAANGPTTLTMEIGSTGASITGSTGTLTLGGDVTVNATSGSSGASISCPVALGATRTFTVADDGTSATDLTISGVVSGATFGITKAGAGTLTLSGTNTYSGTTTVISGTIGIGNNSALGSSGLTIGGTSAVTPTILASGGARSISNNVTLAAVTTGNGTIGGSNDLTFSGSVTNNVASRTLAVNNTGTTTFGIVNLSESNTVRTLTITGTGSPIFGGVIQNNGTGAQNLTFDSNFTGTATINGTNTYSGTTTLSSGTFVLGNKSAFGTSSVAMNGVSVSASTDLSGANAITNTVSDGGNNTFTGSNNIEFSGTWTDTATRTITNNLSSGTLKLSGPVNLSSNASSNTLTVNGSGATTISNTIANGGTSTLCALTYSGAGTLTLSGSNTYTGITTIASGVVSVATINNGGVAGNLGQASSVVANLVLGGGTLRYTGATASTDRGFTLTTATTSSIEVTVAANTLTISGASANTTGALTKIGAGTLLLSAANNHTGTTTVNAGTLTYGINNALSSGAVTVDGATAVMSMLTFSDTVGTVTVDNGGSITSSTGVLTSTGTFEMKNGPVSAILAGSGIALNKTTSGTVTLSGVNTYTGVTTINAGVLSVATINNGGTAGNLGQAGTGAANLVLGGGTLQYTGTTATTNRAFTLTAATTSTLDVTVAATTLAFSGASANTTGSLTKIGAGTLSFGALTLKNLTISAGTLADGGSTITVNGNIANSGTYSGTGKILLTGGSAAHALTGSGGFYGNLELNDSNGATLTGTATINGNLTLTSGGPVSGDLTVTSGASNTLFMGSGSTSSGNGDVVGKVNRVDSGAFGNPNVIITKTAGTVASIDVTLTKGPTSKSTSVQRTYVITPNTGSLLVATVRLHYLQSELNGNSENTGAPCTLQLWREDTTTNTWAAQGSSNCSASNDSNRWVELAGVASFSPWTIAGAGVPTACKLEAFAASRSDDGVVLEWRTGYEVNNVGFNIYKQDQSGNMVRLTPNPVAGSALMVRRGTPLTAGLSYSWTDSDTKSGETPRYWLEDIDASGQNVWNGPFWIDENGKPSRPPSPGGGRSVTINSMNAQVAKEIASSAKGFQYEPVGQMESKAKPTRLKGEALTKQADLAGNAAVKISVRQEGWYRVNQPDLSAAGLDGSFDPRNLQLYVDGQQIPMIVKGEDDGRFDPQDSIEFYGLGIDTSSTDTRVYWLTVGQQQGDRIKAYKGSPKKAPADGFQYTVQRKDRLYYFSNIPNGDRENFFGAFIYYQATDQTLNVTHIAPAANATLEVAMQGFNVGPHTVGVSVNGTLVGTLSFNDQAYSVSTMSFAQSLLTEGTNTVTMVAQAGNSDFSFVDYMRLTYLHSYDADNNALKITAGAAQSVTVNGFSDPAIRVMDITDATTPKWMLGSVRQTPQGYSVLLATSGGTGSRTLLVFADSQVKSAAKVAANAVSKWRQPSNSADLVIVSYGAFSSSLQTLKSLRESQGLQTQLVDIEDVYDEFNAGDKSPQALKDFLSYASTNWKKRPRYVLLAGSASFDPRNYLGLGDTDFVPTIFVQTEHIETASDDALADFDNDGIPEMAVGRLPALTTQEATTMVNKVVGYDQGAKGDGVLLVADINDGFDFEGADNQLRALVPAGTNVQEIRRSSDPQAEQDLLNALNQGKWVVNYVGHGSVNLWRANLLVSTDGASLTNTQRLSIFVAMTCLNGYFIDQRSESLAHALINSPGGAAAVWSSSGLTEPDAQALANQELFRQIFNGASARLGDATIKAKAAISDLDVRRTWILIGDPTTRLK